MEISSGLNYKKMSMILKRCNHSASLTKRKIRPLAIINCFSLTQKYRLKIESCRVILIILLQLFLLFFFHDLVGDITLLDLSVLFLVTISLLSVPPTFVVKEYPYRVRIYIRSREGLMQVTQLLTNTLVFINFNFCGKHGITL
jgi:hypothetical protein